MTSTPPPEETDGEEELAVPVGVIDGIEDVEAGRTADGDDLDDALDL